MNIPNPIFTSVCALSVMASIALCSSAGDQTTATDYRGSNVTFRMLSDKAVYASSNESFNVSFGVINMATQELFLSVTGFSNLGLLYPKNWDYMSAEEGEVIPAVHQMN